MKEFYIIITKV